MHRDRDVVRLSPSDLTDRLYCPHLTQLELAATRGEIVRPGQDPASAVVRRRGDQHERDYLERLRGEGLAVVDAHESEEATLRAMRSGADVVSQAALDEGRWRGRADFLRRVNRPSDLGDWGYEVADTKLARRVTGAALLQIAAYSQRLATLQGCEPERMHVVLGDMSVCSFPVARYAAYHRRARRRLEDDVDGPPIETAPDPVPHCAVCRWNEACMARRRREDDLSLVAGLRRDQAKRLCAAGVATLAQLAQDGRTVPGIGRPALARLRAQARLQAEERSCGERRYELLPPEGPGRGLAALPPPSPGDLVLDLEGDPFVGEGGLEYLIGIVEMRDGAPRYHRFWAHDRAEEKRSFEGAIDLVMDRLVRQPELHVYHYASYEPAAFKRLMGRHATREDELDRLLRGGVFVDLYRAVRQGVRVGQESYSLKRLEPYYMPARTAGIADAASSIVAYESYLESGDLETLEQIEAYNREDCESTWRLRTWLEGLRDEAAGLFGEELPRPQPREGAPSDKRVEADALRAPLLAALTATNDPHQELLAHLLGWHQREAKPDWWTYFHRCDLDDEELVEDAEAIGGLSYDGVVDGVGRSLVHRYRFDPSQEYKLREGDTPHDPRTQAGVGAIHEIDRAGGFVDLKRDRTSQAPHPRSLIPAGPISTRPIEDALTRIAAGVVAHGIDAGPFRAGLDLLCRRPPATSLSGPAEEVALSLDAGCLAVQGPPGAGKTYTGAGMILALVRAGKRVGVSATSHKAIGALLREAVRRATDEGVSLRVLQRADEPNLCDAPGIEHASGNEAVDRALAEERVDVVAGTPWLFSRPELGGALDVLIVDEAGQMSLANAIAVSQAARGLVLLGDPAQLAQPSRGTHPPGAGASALGHLLAGHATLPPERGLFLETTRRLHPALCAAVSELAYEGRLHAAPDCARQSVAGEAGLRFCPVRHEGNRTSSPEEAERVAEEVERLLGRPWTDRGGHTRSLVPEDILVVAPYNAQVACLTERLPDGVRVGTVDRFQGQEAPVAILSMTTSSSEELPRDMEFLYSRNRLNVALSRAQGLAIMVASPALLDVACQTPPQMLLASALCRLVELGTPFGEGATVDVAPSPRELTLF